METGHALALRVYYTTRVRIMFAVGNVTRSPVPTIRQTIIITPLFFVFIRHKYTRLRDGERKRKRERERGTHSERFQVSLHVCMCVVCLGSRALGSTEQQITGSF